MSPAGLDAVELEIAWAKLVAVVEEAAVALVRTSFSTIVREAKDYTCILLDRRGRLVAQPTSSAPAFTGTMPRTMKHLLEYIPVERWEPGDLVITNDPWMGTGHLNDVNVARPIFFEGELVGFAGIVAHMADIGGMMWSAGAREVYEEGVQIPICRLFVRGQPNRDVFDFIRANVRMQEIVLGDLYAMNAAAETVDRRLGEFLGDFGRARWDSLVEEVILRCEHALRAAIRKLPDGTYRHRIELDGYGSPLEVRVRITVKRDRLTVDYAGTAAQVAFAMNSPYTYTNAYTCYPIKCLLGSTIPNNEGTFRAIEVIAPEGTIVNPRYPAAVGARNLTGHALYAVLFGALARVLPDRVLAEGSAPRPIILLSGFRASGARFQNMFFVMGGLGASKGHDGSACLPFPTNTQATPVEVMETTTPILVERKEIVPDSGGPGQFRGGCAQEVEVRNLSPNPMRVSILAERTQQPPGGLFGGGRGGSPHFRREDGLALDPKGISIVEAGQSFTVRTHGAGGYGRPGKRLCAAVAADVENGYVTPSRARDDYGFDGGRGRPKRGAGKS